jgi:hypothetical protein
MESYLEHILQNVRISIDTQPLSRDAKPALQGALIASVINTILSLASSLCIHIPHCSFYRFRNLYNLHNILYHSSV